MVLSTFTLNIKSLVSDFTYGKSLSFSEWTQVAGFMKKAAASNPDDPEQLVNYITSMFEGKALQDYQDTFDAK